MSTELDLTCHYCDFKWEISVYTESQAARSICPKCGDKRKTIKPKDGDKIDSYAGAPAFSEDLTTEDILDLFEKMKYID
jgi:hypothetical protein